MLSLTIMSTTAAMASSAKEKETPVLSSDLKAEQDIVNDYLNNLGYKSIPGDAVLQMNNRFVQEKSVSNWDLVFDYINTGYCPDEIEINFDKDSIEIIENKIKAAEVEKKDGNATKSTYTIYQNEYSNVVSHLDIGRGYLSAFTGRYYWVTHYNAPGAVSVYVFNPVKDISKHYYDGGSGTMVYHSGSVCTNPPGGDWYMTIDGQGYIYGALMREN